MATSDRTAVLDDRPPVAGLLTALPRGGQILHLYLRGYQPGAKRRSIRDNASLCNVSVGRCTLVPFADSLGMKPSDTDPCPRWTWCRTCIGHAVDLASLSTEVLTWIATGPVRT